MKTLSGEQRFWVAILVIGGFLLFGAAATFIPSADGTTIFVNTVLSTMGPLVGWVVKGLFDGADATGKADDPLYTKETE
ncbi:hypothetical protein [Novosphingopyxis sp. YJ-S2-01]|uniref:hypothetical protein n=1 Tax=Novosphingopyxis sp. YJ-S2-01 TaxID=2794021 RepID=UPI000C66351F|nr:hypothetical protein [Novosphingopyxis sp. YJ-S2-01]MAC12966.1 hypothetical protein [Sphingorhabdus sp.]MBH9537540.1 hypothetical protein [Novosphingopyxis sp. YJ-S2-01]|tara:strand:- start:244 stop:480 length:237 start_codon:yes stop_codon:yes gene_type:complete